MRYVPTLYGFAKATAQLALALLGLAAGALYFGQGYLVYPSYLPPGSREIVASPADFEIPFEDLELTSPDGVKVKAFLILQRKQLPGKNAEQVPPNMRSPHNGQSDEDYIKSRPTVLFFHANAGNVGHRLPLARIFYTQMRCNIIMLSYRGYGLSQGTASEKGIRMDAQTTLDYVLAHPLLHGTKLLTYGQSIGGAVSIDLASRNPNLIHALVLENTFRSIPLVAHQIIPLLRPFLFLCSENWRSERALKLIPAFTHILLLSGLRDEIVPPDHMKVLREIVGADGKKVQGRGRREWVEFPDGTHNDTCVQQGYWASVKQFVDNVPSS